MAELIRVVPPLPQTERGVFCQIATDAAGERLLYCNGTNVIWRSIAQLAEGKGAETPEDVFCWKQHTKRTTCVAMSPNSNWVVSGDTTGAVRLWGSKGEHIQKAEYKLWAGSVRDVSFSGDSTRIFACGEGNEVSAVAMIADTGSKTGQVSGHAAAINSISFRSQRPFRIATGSEDKLVAFHEGPPFKFTRSQGEHSNFVNCVRYSPDGEWCLSAGSDSKLVIYEGKTGDLVKEFAKPDGITGSLWAAAWSPDSSKIATAGGDKVFRIWDRETGKQAFAVKVGSGSLEDQQIGLSWVSAGRVISVCLGGRLLIWDIAADGAATLATTVEGTSGPATCLGHDKSSATLLHGSADGKLAVTPAGGPTKTITIGKGIQHIVTRSKGGEAWVIALDDSVYRIAVASAEAAGPPVQVKEFAVGAVWLDAEETKLLVVSGKQNFHCVSADKVEWTKEKAVHRRPTAVASLPGKFVAVALEKPDGSVGGVASQRFEIFVFGVTDTASGDGLVPHTVLEGHTGEVCSMKFSPSGEHLISGDASNKVLLWNMASDPPAKVSEFVRHTARVMSVDWLADGRRFVSGSLDQNVVVSDIDTPGFKVQVPEGHKGGVAAVVGCSEDTIASVGHDGFLSVHKLGAPGAGKGSGKGGYAKALV